MFSTMRLYQMAGKSNSLAVKSTEPLIFILEILCGFYLELYDFFEN